MSRQDNLLRYLSEPVTLDPVPPNCESHPWGFFGLTKVRIICDGPIQPDGSWIRRRVIGVPAHYENQSSSCSAGEYYSNCTFYPGGWVDAQPLGTKVITRRLAVSSA
jgi:hypothetical protein